LGSHVSKTMASVNLSEVLATAVLKAREARACY
jgi:hypothetical protein